MVESPLISKGYFGLEGILTRLFAGLRDARSIVYTTFAVCLLCCLPATQATAQDNPRFRDFRSRAPTPAQLIQALKQQPRLDVPSSPNQALQKRLGEFMQGLTPNERKGLLDAGKDYLERQAREGNSVKLPKDLEDLVDPEMRDQLRDQFSDEDLSQFRDILKGLDQSQSNNGSGQSSGRSDAGEKLAEAMERLGESFDDKSLPSFDRSKNRRDNRNQVNPPRPGNNSNQNERPRLGGDSNRQPFNGEGNQRNGSEMEDPENSSDRRQAELDRFRNRERSNRREPAEEMDGPRFDIPEPPESKGTKFDRMIMDAISKGVERDAADGGGSGLANSLRSLLDGMAGTVQDRLAGRRISRDSNFSNNSSSGGPNMVGNLRFPSIGGGGGGSTRMPDVQQVSWAMLAILGIVVLAVAVWLLLKMVPKDDEVRANDPTSFRRSFRLSQIRSPAELVNAVDGYLLAHFGKPSSWWHSRRAEVALNSTHSDLSESVCELVDGYEFARYSEVGNTLSETKVQRCAGILAELVSRPAVNSGPNLSNSPPTTPLGKA